MGDSEALHGIYESRPKRMLHFASCERGFQIAAPLRDRARAVSDAFVVTEIVAIAHERIDGGHRQTAFPGKQQKRIVEVLGLSPRKLGTPRIGLGYVHAMS